MGLRGLFVSSDSIGSISSLTLIKVFIKVLIEGSCCTGNFFTVIDVISLKSILNTEMLYDCAKGLFSPLLAVRINRWTSILDWVMIEQSLGWNAGHIHRKKSTLSKFWFCTYFYVFRIDCALFETTRYVLWGATHEVQIPAYALCYIQYCTRPFLVHDVRHHLTDPSTYSCTRTLLWVINQLCGHWKYSWRCRNSAEELLWPLS